MKKYLNAAEVLPKELLTEIQKYAGGALLYVPPTKEKAWGEVSGQKRYYQKRNRMLVNKYLYGTTVEQLAKEYRLSEDTVKKIVYSKKNTGELIFRPDISSAKEYSEKDFLEEWIHTYLLFERMNRAFSDGLYQEDRFYLGPLAMPLHLFSRSSGPEKGMKWLVAEEVFEARVNGWLEKIRSHQVLPPIIVGYAGGCFELNCNSPLFEALLREKIEYFPVVVWCTGEMDYQDFIEKHIPCTQCHLVKE